jgi:hypothetical protein
MPEQLALFREGVNTVAVYCRQTVGGQFIDVGIQVLRQSQGSAKVERR